MNRQQRRQSARLDVSQAVDLSAKPEPEQQGQQLAGVHDPITHQALAAQGEMLEAQCNALHDAVLLQSAVALLTTAYCDSIEEALKTVLDWRHDLANLAGLLPTANGDADQHGDVDSNADAATPKLEVVGA